MSGLLKHTESGTNMKLNIKQKMLIRCAVLEQFGEHTQSDVLLEEICQLRFRVAELEKANSDLGWQISGESMGR